MLPALLTKKTKKRKPFLTYFHKNVQIHPGLDYIYSKSVYGVENIN